MWVLRSLFRFSSSFPGDSFLFFLLDIVSSTEVSSVETLVLNKNKEEGLDR